MIELLLVYIVGTLLYPIAIVAYALESEMYIGFSVWLATGVGAWYLLSKLQFWAYKYAWLAAWFMPSTIICGAAAVVPWPIAFLWIFDELYGCISVESLAITLICNFIVVFGGRAMVVAIRSRRKNA